MRRGTRQVPGQPRYPVLLPKAVCLLVETSREPAAEREVLTQLRRRAKPKVASFQRRKEPPHPETEDNSERWQLTLITLDPPLRLELKYPVLREQVTKPLTYTVQPPRYFTSAGLFRILLMPRGVTRNFRQTMRYFRVPLLGIHARRTYHDLAVIAELTAITIHTT